MQVYEDSDATLQMEGFYAQIADPLLSNVDIKYVNASVDPGAYFFTCLFKVPEAKYTSSGTLVKDPQNNLYKGSEIVTLGKLSSENDEDKINAVVASDSVSGSRTLRACLRSLAIKSNHSEFNP